MTDMIARWGRLARITRTLIVIAMALLLVPLIAMRFTRAVDWTGFDFVAASAIMGTAILGVEVATRYLNGRAARVFAYGALAAAFLLIWAEGAVGLFA